jgi:hypothetical protein
VPNVTDINFDVQTPDVLMKDVLANAVVMNDIPANTIATNAVQTAELWRARPGAFSPRSAFLGTGVSGVGGGTVGSGTVGSGTAPCVVVRQVPRVPGKAALAFPVPQSAAAAQLGHINNYNQMTSVYAFGEGASGPPPYREPA